MKDEPAFPQTTQYHPSGDVITYASPGLTIRQHFASLAMQGLLVGDVHDNKTYSIIATQSIEMADALIEALVDPSSL